MQAMDNTLGASGLIAMEVLLNWENIIQDKKQKSNETKCKIHK